jgi:hypothetical protein
MMIFLSSTASSNGTDFVSSWSLRSVLPFGMFGGSSKLLLADLIELMLRCDCRWLFLCFLPLSDCHELWWYRAMLAFSYTSNPYGRLYWICLQILYRRWHCSSSRGPLYQRSRILFLYFLDLQRRLTGIFSLMHQYFFLRSQLMVNLMAVVSFCSASSDWRH